MHHRIFIDDGVQDGDEVDFFNRGQIFWDIVAKEKEFGQKRAKCVKLEKCTATPGSAHLEQGIYASQVSLCFDRKANELANISWAFHFYILKSRLWILSYIEKQISCMAT